MTHFSNRRQRIYVLAGTLAVAFSIAIALQAAPPNPPPVSTYAPIADLAAQVDYYLGTLEKALLASADEYSEAKQKAVRKNAGTLAALALVVGNHDQDHVLKKSAGELLVAAQQLVNVAADQEAARKQLFSVRQAAGGDAGDGSGRRQWGRRVAGVAQGRRHGRPDETSPIP
jgi:hypothetical protein